MTETESKWTERVREWRASAQRAEQFAQGRGFEASTLRYWASRLRTKAPPEAATREPSVEERGRDTLRLVRVRRSRVRTTNGTVMPSGMRESGGPMLIAVGGARIEVRTGFDRGLLKDVVDALGGTR